MYQKVLLHLLFIQTNCRGSGLLQLQLQYFYRQIAEVEGCYSYLTSLGSEELLHWSDCKYYEAKPSQVWEAYK